MSSDDSSSSTPRYSAYDHLKKEVAAKSAKSAAATSAGVPTVLKVFFLGIIIFGGLLASGILTGPGPFDGGTNNNNDPNVIDDDSNSNPQQLTTMCVNHEPGGLSAHYHYTVNIAIDGQPGAVPANIGIESDTCFRPIHTHSAGGNVHVELPASYDGGNPTIGDFFTIWGYAFSSTQLLGETGNVTMAVNSETKTGSIQNYVPNDGDTIHIAILTDS